MEIIVGETYMFDFVGDDDYAIVLIVAESVDRYAIKVVESSYMSTDAACFLTKDCAWFQPKHCVLTKVVNKIKAPIKLNDALWKTYVNMAIDSKDHAWLQELSEWKGVEV